MSGLNKVMLIGNVGQDPDIRSTSSGTRVAKLTLATNRKRKDQSGTPREEVQWHRLTAWGRLAEIVETYVKKGDKLYVEGRLEYTTTENEAGVKRYWTDIVVNELVMLGSTETSTEPQQSRESAVGDANDSDLPF